MDYKQKYLKYKEKYLQIKKLDGLIGGAASASSSSTETFNLFEAVKIATSTEPISNYYYIRDGTYYGNAHELLSLVRWYTDNNPSLESFEICKQAIIDAKGDYKKAKDNLIIKKKLEKEKKEREEREIKSKELEQERLEREIKREREIKSKELEQERLKRELEQELEQEKFKREKEREREREQLEKELKRIKTLLINNLKNYFSGKELYDIVAKKNVSYESKQYGSYWYKIDNFTKSNRRSIPLSLYGSTNNINWIYLEEIYVDE